MGTPLTRHPLNGHPAELGYCNTLISFYLVRTESTYVQLIRGARCEGGRRCSVRKLNKPAQILSDMAKNWDTDKRHDRVRPPFPPEPGPPWLTLSRAGGQKVLPGVQYPIKCIEVANTPAKDNHCQPQLICEQTQGQRHHGYISQYRTSPSKARFSTATREGRHKRIIPRPRRS